MSEIQCTSPEKAWIITNCYRCSTRFVVALASGDRIPWFCNTCASDVAPAPKDKP